MQNIKHANKHHILAFGLLLALSAAAEPDTDKPAMPDEAAPTALRSTSHPIEVWDEVFQKKMFYRSTEEQKAMESLPLGMRALLLSNAYMKVSSCQKMVIIKHKENFTLEDTIYTKRGDDGKIYKRTDRRKIMRRFIYKNTILNLPGGETWDLQGNVAIKFPDPQKEAFVQHAMSKAATEREKAIKTAKSPEDTRHTYLCETFSDRGKDYFRVVIIEPKIYKKIKDSLAADAVEGIAGVVSGRASADASWKATEMVKAGATQRKEHIIDKATMLPVSQAEYNSHGKRTEFTEYKSIEKLDHLDGALFKVPEDSKLLFPKSLMAYLLINGKQKERERIFSGKETNKK